MEMRLPNPPTRRTTWNVPPQPVAYACMTRPLRLILLHATHAEWVCCRAKRQGAKCERTACMDLSASSAPPLSRRTFATRPRAPTYAATLEMRNASCASL
eukprot:896695-Pyramimonas_sp.AAC.1